MLIIIALPLKIRSQETVTGFRVGFRVNSTEIDPGYGNNSGQLSEIISFLQRIGNDSTLSISEISFCGQASPEGSYQLNRRLAQERLDALEKAVRKEVDIPDSIIIRNDSYISWEYLGEQVTKSDLTNKRQVLDILNQEARLVKYYGKRHIDHRIVKLQRMDNGKTWDRIKELYFPEMRNACVIFITYKREIPPVVTEPVQIPAETAEKQDNKTDSTAQTAPLSEPIPSDEWTRHLHLKTNAIGWVLAIANAAVEVDLANHFSFTLPVYYSALDYFTSTIKFRTLAFQPEVRYWTNGDNTGFFAGGHFGLAWYNIAVNGDKRYQDHDGNSPAIGGGVSVGYRKPVSKNGKWHIEFTIGAGVYSTRYDTFVNERNGRLLDTKRKTYIGPDNAAVSISYCIDLTRHRR